ncbi:hypothetical protein Tco_0599785 [Tanacetum coccineum]
MASTPSVQEEGQSITPIVDKINMIKKKLVEGECVFVDDDVKPLKKVECLGDLDSKDEVEPDNNEMASFLAKPSGLDMVQRACWNNGGKHMVMLIKNATTNRTMMTCTKVRKNLTMFKLYAITWISRFEVDQRNRLLDDLSQL